MGPRGDQTLPRPAHEVTEQPGSWEWFLGMAVCTCLVNVSRCQPWGGTGPRSEWGASRGHMGRPGECGLSILWEVKDWQGGGGAKFGLRSSPILCLITNPFM